MESRKAFYAKKNSSVYKNERLTAIAGAILFVLIIVELIITANLRNMISFHIFVGVLLSGPLVVKMLSTGYRFVRYYTRSSEYVKSGPPKPLLRILAPFLVLTTILVFVSGFLLIQHWNNSLIFKLHAASVALWLPLLAIHIYAYLKKVPGLVARDLTSRPQYYIKGRKGRIGLNVASLIIGLIAAFILTPWHIGRHGSLGLPTPLVLGLTAAVLAVLIVTVQKIKNKKAKWIVGTAGVAAFSSFVISQHSLTPTTNTAQAKTIVKAKVKPHKAEATSSVNFATSKGSTHNSQTSSAGNSLVKSSTASRKTSQPSSSSTASSKTSQSSSSSTVSRKISQPSSSSTVSRKTSQSSSSSTTSSKTSQPSSSTQNGSSHSNFSYAPSTQSSGTSSDRQTKAS